MFRLHACAAFVAAVCFLTAPPALRSQDAADKAAIELDTKLIEDAQKTSEIMKNLGHLSDVIGPRLTGSANLKRANDWGAEVMKKYGLTNVHLEPWEIPIGWERGSRSVRKWSRFDPKRLSALAARGARARAPGRPQTDHSSRITLVEGRSKYAALPSSC